MKYLLLLWSLSLYSHEYTLSEKKYDFIYMNKKLVSENCKKGCLALKVVVPKDIFTNFDSRMGKNPATWVCKNVKGEIVMATSKLGHQTFFCKFSDNSYIHSGHLL